VVRAYYGAVVAAERAKTIETAAHAAHAHVAQAEAMVRQGLVTKSDALLASVRAGQVDADLAEAIGAAQTAQSELAVLLGRNGDPAAGLVPAQPLPSGDRIRAVVSADTAAQSAAPRADVQAASRGLDAARADRLRARSSFLPRLNAFARYDWNSAARLYTGDRNWTTGIMASWTPFAGARDVAEVQITNGRASAAQAQSEAAAANARLEAEQTRIALSVALTRLAIAEHAVAQSAEAHRIVAKKYDGGLATVVELLDAQATETQSALALLQTRWAAIVAGAERLRALGRDPASLEVFDQTTVAASTRDSAGEPP
jgi:outer membrane protein TolC